MAQTLEEYAAQALNAYRPAKTAVQSQIDSLSGQLTTAQDNINRNYNNQQAELDRQRDMAASAATMQAAGNGGSFGGAAEIANRKYYEQNFIPAQQKLQTNQANDLATARQNYNDRMTSLNSQLSSLDAEANSQALKQYYADLEAEKNRELQRQSLEAQERMNQAQLRAQEQAQATQNAYYQYLIDEMKRQSAQQNTPRYSLSSSRNKYGGFDWTDSDGNLHRAATVATAAGGDFNDSLANVLSQAAQQGDQYSRFVLDQINSGARFAKNDTGKSAGNSIYDTLGIRRA